MKKTTLTFRTGLLLSLSFHIQLASADDQFRARIVKLQGEVHVIDDRGERRDPEKTKFLVNKMDTVVTGDNARAVVQFDDGAMSVLDEKSSLRVEEAGWISQLSGKVYYLFRKVFGSKQEPKKVKTKFATIGIRGTTFIVNADDDEQSVALQEGRLNIESPGKDYEIHKQRQADDFASFKQQMQEKQDALQREYREYRENVAREFIEYKKSFDLEAHRMIRFDGNRVNEVELSDRIQEEFENLESFAGDYIQAYKELEESTEQ